MADLKKIDEALTYYVRPQTFPLAVKMCKTADELPEKVRFPMKDMGVNIALCHAIGMARRYGWTIAIDKTVSCYAPAISLGFLPITPDIADGSFQASLGLWGMTREQASEAIKNLPKLDQGKYQFVVMAPLDRTTFEPDLIMLYGNPAQIWILLAGYLSGTGKAKLDTSLAAGAGCTTYITKNLLTNEAQFALVGTGERLVPHPQDYECAFSIPMSKVEATIKGMESGYKTGVFRYPIPSYMRYDSQHPPGYDKMRSHLLGES